MNLFIKNVTFPLFAHREGLGGIMQDMRLLEESQFWPRERILDLQRSRLKSLLVHAYENTAFYRKRFHEAGFNPYTFNYPDELTRIPILTKDQIRENVTAMLAGNFRPDEIHASQTGGTSGVKMNFYRDNRCLAGKEAALHRFDRWAGWDFGKYMGLVWPAHQDFIGYTTFRSRVRNHFYKRLVIFPAAVMDDASCSDYLCRLRRYLPTMILAFSSPIHELAKYMERNGIWDIRVKGIVTTGEPLYNHQRELVSRVFHCDVMDSYRSREAGPMAQECEAHEGMHINAEYLHIDVDHSDLPGWTDGQTGNVIVTDLLNYGMPLIRYSMDDVAMMNDKPCPCGRGLPVIDKVMGRALDVFVTPKGELVSTIALVMYLVNGAPGLIGQMQVIQDRNDHLTFRMTRDPLPSKEVMDHQKGIVRKLFGEEMKITYEYVDSISREASGKYLFAKRMVPMPEHNGDRS